MRIMLAILFLFLAITCLAHGDDSPGSVSTYNQYSVVNDYSVSTKSLDGGVAMSLARQTNFSGISQRWQFSLGAGHYRDATGLSLSTGKKFCDDCALYTGDIETDGTHLGYSVHVNWSLGHGR